MNGKSDMLGVFHELPDELLSAAPTDLARILGGPALIHLAGARRPALFVSVMLHGNETTGFSAIQRIFRQYADASGHIRLPRDLSVFIGNVVAGEHNRRRLDDQPDYNRVWPGTREDETPEHAMMAQIVAEMRRRGTFASIDIHNNTGRNPLYACLNRTDPAAMHLACLFSRTQVYFTEPKGVQSLAFSQFCPAITVECGHSGQPEGIERAARLVDAALHLDHWPEAPPSPHDYDLYHTIAVVKVAPGTSIGFGESQAELALPLTLEYWNFRKLEPGTAFARQRRGCEQGLLLQVTDKTGRPATEEFLYCREGTIHLRRPVVPSMLTPDQTIIAQDCLCYFMEPMGPLHA